MKNNRIIVILVLVLFVVIGLVAFSGSSREGSEETIKVGGLFGLTDFSSSWGEIERNAVILAIDEINESGGIDGKKLELFVEDTFSDNAKSVSATLKLTDINKVDVIVGPTWAATFKGTLPSAEDKDVIMITPSDSITAMKRDKNYRNVFSLWFDAKEETHAIAEHFNDMGYKDITFLIVKDPFFIDIAERVMEHGEKYGMTYSMVQHDYGETDFRTRLSKIKESDPDVVFYGVTEESEQVNVLKQKQAIYPEGKFFTTESVAEFVPKYPELLEGVSFIRPVPAGGEFAESYRERFNQDPIFSASNAYDAMMVLAQTMDAVGTDAEKMEAYMYQNTFDTVTFGPMRFDDLGGPSGGEFEIKTVFGGEVK